MATRRRQFEYITPEGVSGYFMQQNCGKEDICLDLANPGAREVMRRLVRVSDVVVENFRPGVMKRLGLDYESLRRLNPSVILCSISAFGQNSPYANRPAGDMVVQAMTGIASLTGDPDGPPQTVGMSLSDTSGGGACLWGDMRGPVSSERDGPWTVHRPGVGGLYSVAERMGKSVPVSQRRT